MDNEDIVMRRDYLLALTEPLTVDDLKPLIGCEFPVKVTGRQWGKDVVETDKIIITNIKLDVDVESGLSINGPHIYSDYYLKDRKKYNAWNGLSAIKRYISTLDM